MRFNIVSNICNGVGLQRDYELLRASLERLGHKVQGIYFKSPDKPPEADISIFLEVVEARFLGKRNWIVPNPEWWFNGWDSLLPRFECVLAKTKHARELFQRKHRNVKLLGWKSRDLYQPEIQREPKFLHVAGKSQTKNTLAVIEAWSKIHAPLTIVSQHYSKPAAGITYLTRASDAELIQLMNSHQFHVMPSAYEGWGHSLHEGLGCGAIVLTTNAAPMNEFGVPRELLIPASTAHAHHAVNIHSVRAADVAQAVNRALNWRGENTSRQQFLMEAANFEARLETLVGRVSCDR